MKIPRTLLWVAALLIVVSAGCIALLQRAVQVPEVRVGAAAHDPARPHDHYVTGSVVPSADIGMLLFTDEFCPPAVAHGLHAYRSTEPQGQVDCWQATSDDKVEVIDAAGTRRRIDTYWAALPRGVLQADGSVTITEPGYDSNTFADKIAGEEQQRAGRLR
jgi:hypothetical protein